MNNSGQVIPYLTKQGIKPENILVVHDELELPFGEIKIRAGGSAKGHNGLKSIIQAIGPEFHRLRFGIGRPENREEVPDYVLEPFAKDKSEVDKLIEKAVGAINDYILSNA
jgi:PTH1 family peptidyl-tRNA hydrolase